MILADTDVLIDYLVGIEPVRSEIERLLSSDQLATTVISAFELLSGADDSRRGRAARSLAEALPTVSLDLAGAMRAADVRRHLDETGKTIGMGDRLIAGIALACDYPLFTRNRTHFQRVPGLKLLELEAR